jgi:hypothetical protein
VFCSTIPARHASRSGLGLLIATLLTPPSAAQEAPVILRGTWTATAGPTAIYNGVWSARLESGTPNSAQGSWGVIDGSGHVVLQGTWSAQKRAKVWQGSWSAVVTGSGGRSSSSRKFAGTWQANVDANESGSLLEMLRRTLENSVSGTWQSGPLKGQWTVKASPPQRPDVFLEPPAPL